MDDYKETPKCHREWWQLCASEHPFVAITAPRGHAKSTAITHCYTLASVLFKDRKFVVLVSDTYEQAVLFLQDIKKELVNNEDLIQLFGVSRLEKDAENDLIVRMLDGQRFRIIAKGAEQKMRGLKWDGMRPDLIICHEEGTDIYTEETGWIKNQDYPGARRIKAHEAYELSFEDGSKEVVSGDHRYLVGGVWKYPWEMRQGDDVTENISEDILKRTLKSAERPLDAPIISEKKKSSSGLKRISRDTRLQRLGTTFATKVEYFLKLRSLLRKTRAGKRQRALYVELEKCKQLLRGLIKRLSDEYMKNANSDPLKVDVG